MPTRPNETSTETSQPRVVVTLGEVMLRLSPPDREQLEVADSLDLRVGGAEGNVAVALAALGVPVAWVSALPDTPLGRRVASALRAAGVDVSFVTWTQEGRVGLYFVEFGAAPRPTTVHYDRGGSAFSVLDSFDVAALDGARFAMTSGITPAVGPSARRLTDAFVAAARAAGAGLCVDVNYRSRLWSHDEAREGLGALLRQAEVVVCSRRDAEAVFGCSGDDEQIAHELRERWAVGAEVVALTLSERGVVVIAADGRVARQAAYPTAMVDRFGAGDAFTAGFLWGLLDGDIETAARAGAALAALKCTVHGDFARFTADEVRAVIDDPPNALLR